VEDVVGEDRGQIVEGLVDVDDLYRGGEPGPRPR
jgi:hypothetical protein